MNTALTTKDILSLFTRYIGQPVWIRSLYAHSYGKELEHQVGILSGIKDDAIQIHAGEAKYWLPVKEELPYYEVKLLLKPLSNLTERIRQTANSLPVTVFITQYYVQLGYDMPVFISPGHTLNCRYMHDLGLADYRSADEIELLNSVLKAKKPINISTQIRKAVPVNR